VPRTTTVIIGAGQAGLALSHELTVKGQDHVVLEGGRLAHRWRAERRPTLRLLTPRWMTRLPGASRPAGDPEGFMTGAELVDHLAAYARSFGAPVVEHAPVQEVRPRTLGGYVVQTPDASFRASNVVIATGHAQVPHVPVAADELPTWVAQRTPTSFLGADELPPGGVLVVGASATGTQAAEELALAGRRVVLAVGAHTRLPRTHRGLDIMWWLDQMGTFDVDVDDVTDPVRARRQPSWQLVGRSAGRDLDLVSLRRLGVELTGRFLGCHGETVSFADDLARTTADADARLSRLLDRIDGHVAANGLEREVLDTPRPAPVGRVAGRAHLDLRAEGIGSVVWATGYRRSYPWLAVPVLDPAGEIRQHRGVTPAPGLYTAGLRFQTRRSSSFVDGARHDAAELSARLTGTVPTHPALAHRSQP
jgi:putative flavoprotein involved in K+ transport